MRELHRKARLSCNRFQQPFHRFLRLFANRLPSRHSISELNMKKTLVAAVLSGLLSAAAYAQSSVNIYGILDTGLIKESGSDVRMGDYMSSRIGFRGTEDLGNGLKATFELEQRFRLNDGTPSSSYSWDEKLRNRLGRNDDTRWTGYANVGLAGQWGAVRLGRVMSLVAETFTMIDPFDQNGIASSYSVNSLLHSHFLSDTVRYDSPNINGFELGLTYTLGDDKHGDSAEDQFVRREGNDGFAINPRYRNGPGMLLANFERVADSGNSYLWDVGGTYQWGDLRLFLGYERTVFKLNELVGKAGNQSEWLTGLLYRMGPHIILASYNRGEIDAGIYDGRANKYAVGYNYEFSKRTTLYSSLTYVDNSDPAIGAIYNSNGTERSSMTGIQIGLNHKF